MEAPVFDSTSSGFSSANVTRYVQTLWRRRWVVIITVAVILGLGIVYTLRQPKVYSSSTSLVIDVTAPRFLDNDVKEVMGEERSSYWFNKEYYETQNKVILSRAVASRVVDKLGLQNNASFLGVEAIKDPAARLEVMKAMDAPAIIQSRIQVIPIKDSRLVNIAVEDSDPKRAALLANEVAEAYMAENLALKLRVTDSASTWLEERLGDLKQRSNQSELAVYDFKKDADVLSTSLENRLSIVSDRLNAYNAALTEARTQNAALRARVEAIAQLRKSAAAGDTSWAEALPQAQGTDSSVKQLRDTFITQRTACVELSERYLEGHPKMLECERKLGMMRQDFERALSNIVSAAETELAEAAAKERNLVKLVDSAKDEAFEVNKKQIAFDRLQRESTNDQRLYELVLKRLKDIELSSLLRTSNVRVLDAARPNFIPVRPIVRKNIFLALVLGIVAGIGLVLLLDFLSNTVLTQQDVEDRLGLAFLGLVPRIEEEKGVDQQARDLYVHRTPKSAVAECCRAIRTNLLFMSPDKPFKTMVVTSTSPQEGKSTSCIHLGVAMAQSGNRVLLVDTDMRRPRLHKAFGVPNDTGISSLVVGDAKWDAAVKSTEVPNLFVLPCGPVPPNPAELLHTKAFAELIKQLGDKFDRIIFDSPPLNAVADSAVLAAQADAVVLVLRAGRTHRELARRALRSLADVQANVFGAILNDVDLTSPKYGDYYYSYKTYGTYYGEKKDELTSSSS